MIKITGRAIVFFLFFFAALAFSGCTGQTQRVKDAGIKTKDSDIGNAISPVGPSKQAVTPKQAVQVGEFELVDTPFGYIKRRIKKVESVPLAPASATPAMEISSPSPPAPKGKVARNVAKVSASVPGPQKTVEKTIKKNPEKAGTIIFNFDNADIYEVINTISGILQINYVVDPNVRGKVTIRTTRGLNKKDLFPVFRQILDANGLSIIQEGALHRIVATKDISHMPLALRTQGDDISPDEQIVIQILPLEFVTAQEMTKLLTPFVSKTGAIVSSADSNTLVVVDKGINILKVLKLVDVFDVNLLEKVHQRFYFFKNIDAEDAAKTLQEIAASYQTSGKEKVNLITINRLNAVLILSSNDALLDKLDAFADQLDIPSEDVEPRIYVYSVKNGEAEQLSGLLKTVFGEGGKKTDKAAGKSFTHPNPLAIGSKKETPKPTEQKPAVTNPGPDNASRSVSNEIKITPDEVRNALIIEATPKDYKIVSGILQRLDVLPRQVLIEATVADITLGKNFEMGVEWTFKNEPWIKTGLLSATVGANGLNYAIGMTEKWQAALSALQQDSKVSILSSPHVLASDNKEARIAISTEIPLASTSYTTTSDSNVLETNIQYRDTGVILVVTPHINESGLVTMDISQEVSEQSASISVAGQDYPTFFKRSVNTTLTVKHGQTIVIGGLIRENDSDTMAGVPCLVDIPLTRYLFGKNKQEGGKTELIVMITPHVIVNLEDVDAVTEEFKQKVGKLRERLENRENENTQHPLF